MEIYHQYRKNQTPAGSIVVKFYHSGGEVRGFLREVSQAGEDDVIFPGEELEPDEAFRAARNKLADERDRSIFVELSEGVAWNPAWGSLA